MGEAGIDQKDCFVFGKDVQQLRNIASLFAQAYHAMNFAFQVIYNSPSGSIISAKGVANAHNNYISLLRSNLRNEQNGECEGRSCGWLAHISRLAPDQAEIDSGLQNHVDPLRWFFDSVK